MPGENDQQHRLVYAQLDIAWCAPLQSRYTRVPGFWGDQAIRRPRRFAAAARLKAQSHSLPLACDGGGSQDRSARPAGRALER
jgi:hypothetical protein